MLRELILDAANHETVSMREYRKQAENTRSRLASSNVVLLDRSATGAGKTTRDIEAAIEAGKSLIVAPTHKQCGEIVHALVCRGQSAGEFIELTEESCHKEKIGEVDVARSIGLSPSQTVCTSCEFAKHSCMYQQKAKEAKKADHLVVTHKRASLTMKPLAAIRQLICIQEDALEVLRPTIESVDSFRDVVRLTDYLRRRLSSCIAQQELRLQADRIHENACRIADAALNSDSSTILPVHGLCGYWSGAIARELLETVKHLRDLARQERKPVKIPSPSEKSVRMLFAMLDGRVDLVTKTNPRESTGSTQNGDFPNARFVAVIKNDVPQGVSLIISDASADPTLLGLISDRRVVDATPTANVQLKHPVIQVPIDVRIGSDSGEKQFQRAMSAIRTVILMTNCKRAGIIMHKKHSDKIEKHLEPYYQDRIRKIGHFRGTDTRGSNEWYKICDWLFVIGTPRVHESAVRHKLLQIGLSAALDRDPRWAGGKRSRDGDYGVYWSGLTPNKRRTIKTCGYLDRDWHNAYRLLVTAELEQSIGRARSSLNDGVPCIVFSTEELPSALVVDEDPPLITDKAHLVLEQIRSRGQPSSPGPSRRHLTDLSEIGVISKAPAVRGRWVVAGEWESKFLTSFLSSRRPT